jgi:predicted nucleic acid-binding protein
LVFLDSNLFLVDRFFPRDAAYSANRAFLDRLDAIDGVVPLVTLLELCGAASFRLNEAETERWLHDFASVYPVRILDPFGAGMDPAIAWLGSWIDDLSRYTARKMTFGDAVIAREADRYGATAIVTWNVKDFRGRTVVPAIRPHQFRFEGA